MPPMPWFRVYSEILDDRKIKRISKRTDQPKAVIIGVWICLLALANDSGERGTLSLSDNVPYTIEDIEEETGIDFETIKRILEEFKSMGMVNGTDCIEITNWDKRQFKSDNSTERVKKHREKRSDETLPKRYSNAPRAEQNKIEQNKPENDPLPQVISAYEKDIGVISKTIGDRLIEMCDEYPLEAILYSIREAALHNKRNLSYCESILRRLKNEGYDTINKQRDKPLLEGYTYVGDE